LGIAQPGRAARPRLWREHEDMADKVRIAIVGGGRTGTPLIEQFMDIPYVELIGVADVDPESPGAALAKKNGVFFTTDALLFAAKGDEIDLLIEGNRHTIIMHDLVARLMISMISEADELVASFHPGDEGIG
jgi:acetaldehyde dehydrogenase (acetylating)